MGTYVRNGKMVNFYCYGIFLKDYKTYQDLMVCLDNHFVKHGKLCKI